MLLLAFALRLYSAYLGLCFGYVWVIFRLSVGYVSIILWLCLGYTSVISRLSYPRFWLSVGYLSVMCGLSFGYVQLSLGYVLVMWSYLVVMSAYLYKWLWEHNYFGLKSWFYAFSSLCVCFSLACCKLFSNFVALFGEKSGQHKEALGFLYLKIAKFHK